ncbi:MAG: alpha/beta hydrolase, partial [Campylobacterota bacterium]|nr:alpha/beta hydrolase [Campylobacterota bacterium]
YRKKSFELSYELANSSQKEVLLVLHGWGSNKEIMMQAFGKTMPEYKHIYLDLPGFGKSSNEMILTTEDYAQIVKLFLENMNIEVKIAMGHSFGGKVSTLLKPPCLVLLSSSGVLVPKVLSVRLKIAIFKFLKPVGLDRLHQFFVSDDAKGMSHEMYETFKNIVNEEFEENFSASQSQALLFWGKEDTATPLWSGEKISGLIETNDFYPLEGDHFFFLKHSAFIAKTISNTCKDSNL